MITVQMKTGPDQQLWNKTRKIKKQLIDCYCNSHFHAKNRSFLKVVSDLQGFLKVEVLVV